MKIPRKVSELYEVEQRLADIPHGAMMRRQQDCYQIYILVEHNGLWRAVGVGSDYNTVWHSSLAGLVETMYPGFDRSRLLWSTDGATWKAVIENTLPRGLRAGDILADGANNLYVIANENTVYKFHNHGDIDVCQRGGDVHYAACVLVGHQNELNAFLGTIAARAKEVEQLRDAIRSNHP